MAIAGPRLKAERQGRWLLARALGASALAISAAPSAQAATFQAACSGSTGSAAALVNAIELANSAPGADSVELAAGCDYTIATPHNNWYGPNGLPAIASDVTIVGNGASIARSPTALAFRFFFVGADAGNPMYISPGAGRLTLRDVTLTGGLANGGGSYGGGGGAGMGGAIFSQGTVVIERSTLTENTAHGGSGFGAGAARGGGGMGTDAVPGTAGGFGAGSFPVVPGGAGGTGTSQSGGQGGNGGAGGGGGGFRTGASGTPATTTTPGDGGGEQTGLGGFGDSAVFGGDGSGGGGDAHVGGTGGSSVGGSGSSGGDGGAFGAGGARGGDGGSGFSGPAAGGGSGGGGGGGGVGGGGGPGGRGGPALGAGSDGTPGRGGGGGFGGGGGEGGQSFSSSGPGSYALGGSGGFGGGGGRYGEAGFGGGAGTSDGGGGGAGMGGAIFNMQGSLTIVASTVVGNAVSGGVGFTPGKGLGGAVFNLSGSFEAVGSTFAGNSAGDDGSSILSLVFDAKTSRAAQATLRGAIVYDGGARAELVSQKPLNTLDGQLNLGSAAADVADFNLVRMSAVRGLGTLTGTPLTGDPLLAPLADNGGPTATMAPAAGSPVIDAGSAFGLVTDQRGQPRPFDFPSLGNVSDGSDIGAVELQPPPAVGGPLAFGTTTGVTLRLASRRIPARGPVRVLVTNANAFPVSGSLSGQTVRAVAIPAKRRRVRLKARAFQVPATATSTVKLKLPRLLSRLLRRRGRLALRLRATVRDPAGNRRVVTKRVTPRLRKR